MNYNPQLSIIIPVYKAEPYLPICLDSIISQTFTDWECILIDDGSPDNCGNICDFYAKKDNRFIVVHKANEGVSIARNKGIEIAKGKWLSFVDSDDYIDCSTYETVIKVAEQKQADLIQWGISLETDGKLIKEIPCKDGWISDRQILDYFEPSTCHKLFLRRIVCDNNIRFPDGLTLSEDRLFSFIYYLKSSKIYGVKDCFYHYRIYKNSSTHKMSEKNLYDEVEIIKLMEQAAAQNSSEDVFKEILIKQKIEAKNHALFLLEKPNCDLWRQLYPEVTPVLLKSRDKKILLYFLLHAHIDFLVTTIISLHKKYAAKNG